MDGGVPAAAEEFADLFREIGEALDGETMEPNPARTDWHGKAIHKLAKRYDELLAVLPAALEQAPDAAVAGRVRDDVGLLAGEIAILAHLAGIQSDAGRLFHLGLDQVASESAKSQLRAGESDKAAYVHLVHGLWLSRLGRVGESDKAMKRLKSASKDAVLRELADGFLDRPKPLTGAPALFRLNGCGVGLYGSRDRRPDGTHIATYCVSALWIPVFPLTAYRVREEGGGRFTFFSKQRLSPFASGVRLAIPALVALLVIGSAVSSHYDSPEYRANSALEVAQGIEAHGDPSEAASAYEQVVRQWGGTEAAREATGAVLRLMVAQLPNPPTLEGVDAATRVLRRAASAGFNLSSSDSAMLKERVDAYAQALGEGSESVIFARLKLLPLERQLWTQDDELTAQERGLRVSLGDLYREDWPVDALSQYASAFPEPEALSHAEPCVRRLMGSASCLRESAGPVQAFIQANAQPQTAQEAASALAAARAEAEDEERQGVLTGEDIERLRAAVNERPQDQELLTALVQGAQGDDRQAACTQLLTSGQPGLLIGEAQVARANCLREQGELAQAAELLSHHVNVRLPDYQTVSAAYDATAHERLERWGRMADEGRFAPELERDLRAARPDDQPNVYSRWVRGQLEADPELNTLKERLQRLGAVVPAALRLGMLQLERAQAESGEARATLLADAERVLLAIADQASDVPAFHITLGQVYFRLGRDDEGARELDAVAQGGDADMALNVAETYRELGQRARARTIAQGVVEGSGEENVRQQAAVMMSQMADDLDEEVSWLARAPGHSANLDAQRAQTRARKSLEEGDRPGADRLYSEALHYWEQETAQTAVSANNAALIYGERYQCTGNAEMLRRATEGLERAVRLEPGNSLLLENILTHLRYDALVAGLARDGRMTVLRPTLADASSLHELLIRGGDRDARLGRLTRPMSRVIDLAKQAEVLAPTRPTAYVVELGWYVAAEDQPALTDLARRIERIPSFTDPSETSWREQWRAGTLDEGQSRRSRAQLVLDDQRVAGAAGDAHSLALAYYLRAEDRGSLFSVTRDVADLSAQIADYRAALESWPELQAQRDLAWTLLTLGVLQAAQASEPLQTALTIERRVYSTSWTLHRVLAGSGADAVRRAVLARPETQEALSLLHAHPARKPYLRAWQLGVDLADAELTATNEPARHDAFQRQASRLSVHLNPLSEEAHEMAALYVED